MPTSATLFSVIPGSTDPIYRQLIDQVERMIAAGHLLPGDELPSVRELAAHLAVNPMTVSKAYAQLEASGRLERRRGLGMVVAATATAHNRAERLNRLRPTLERAAAEARQLEIDPAAAAALYLKLLNRKQP